MLLAAVAEMLEVQKKCFAGVLADEGSDVVQNGVESRSIDDGMVNDVIVFDAIDPQIEITHSKGQLLFHAAMLGPSEPTHPVGSRVMAPW